MRRRTAGRWLAVALGATLIVLTPTAVPAAVRDLPGWFGAGGPGPGPAPQPRVLLARALAAEQVPYQGLATSRGGLALPDLPRLGGTGALLGGTTRMRVWWASPQAWRVSVLTDTGEQDSYQTMTGLVSWDYEADQVLTVLGTPAARLPRADDLLPAQAAHRLLSRLSGTDQVRPLGDQRVAGRIAYRLRITPGDPRSTIGRIDLWVLPGSWLPVRLEVRDRAGSVALSTGFLALSLAPPAASVLQPPAAPGAHREITTAPDLAGLFGGSAPTLPATLAGLPRSTPALSGSVDYGRGLLQLVVLPLPDSLADRVLDGDGLPPTTPRLPMPGGGRAALVGSGPLAALVAERGENGRAFLVAGLVQVGLVRAAAAELLAVTGAGG